MIDESVAEKRQAPKTYSAEFTAWWPAYPRKVDKADAARAFDKARKEAMLEELVDGLDAWVAHWAREHTETRFIPHPARWLNARRWESEPPLPSDRDSRHLSSGQRRLQRGQEAQDRVIAALAEEEFRRTGVHPFDGGRRSGTIDVKELGGG